MMVGGDDLVTMASRDYIWSNLRWLEQTMVWMEERPMQLVGGSTMPKSMPGDMKHVDLGLDGAERDVLR